MNSIIGMHFAGAAKGSFLLDAALDRLGAWLEGEIGSLELLLDISDRRDAIDDIVALRSLHLDATSTPADVRRLLEDAQASLERLMKCVRTISSEDVVDAQVPSDFNAWLRWSGARLRDIAMTLSRALDS